jgi:hypothetical protein
VLGGRTRGIINSKENLKVTEHLGGKTVQRRAQREDRIVEDSVKLCQVGIERVQGVHKENSVSSSEIREVSRRRHLQSYLNTLSAQQGVLEHKLPRGHLYPFEDRREDL